jgi:hypothetical protein
MLLYSTDSIRCHVLYWDISNGATIRIGAARRFYERESFLPLQGEPMKLFRPMADLAKLFKN